MQLFNTTIESWIDAQYVVRQKGFRFSELWYYKNELLQIAHSEEFFSNDTILGLTQEMKQMVFVYLSSVLFHNEDNKTRLLTLHKDSQDFYTFQIKRILDGQSKPCSICDIDLHACHLQNINSVLLELDSQINNEELIAIAGLLILLSDGVDESIPLDDAWIMPNKDDVMQACGVKKCSYEFINRIYEDITFETTTDFPLETKVFVNYSDHDITISDGNNIVRLKSHEENKYYCVVGAFNGNKCYKLFENEAKCSRSGRKLSIYFDHVDSKTYLSICYNNNYREPIPNIISFSCGEIDPLYITKDGKIEFGQDLFNEQLKMTYRSYLLTTNEKVIYISLKNNKINQCLTSKKLLEL